MVCICCALAVNLVYCTTPTGQPYVLWPSNHHNYSLEDVVCVYTPAIQQLHVHCWLEEENPCFL